MAANLEFDPTSFVGKVRVLQLIVFALASGAMMFLVFTLTTEPPAGRAAPAFGILSVAMLALAAGVLPMHRFAPWFILSQARKQLAADRSVVDDELRNRLMMVRQTATIVGAALCEAASFANTIAYSMERHPANLAASALSILLALSFFPTVGRMQYWLDDEVRAIDELRQFGS